MSAGLHVDAIDLDDERVRKQERPDSKTVREREGGLIWPLPAHSA